MKPVKLVMSAFGSYADCVTIDFQDVQQGLFLVTGDTGAGKTTIFDAITYALYDQTSGGVREGAMMRSQYAKEETETYVEYIFSYRDQEYTVRRNPEYLRPGKRKNADGSRKYVKETAKVELILPDGMAYQGRKKEIDQKIEEIIGLDSDQFTQIAMIAQGDFLKLLHAESKERKKIFSKIFQTKLYYRVQDELKERAKKLFVQLEDNSKDVEREIERVECTAESPLASEWQRVSEMPDAALEDLLFILKGIVKEDREVWKETGKKTEQLQKVLDELNGRQKEGEMLNALFASFERAQTERKVLEEDAPKYQVLQQQAELGARAGTVGPARARLLQAADAERQSQEQLLSLERWFRNAGEELEKRKEMAERTAEKEKKEEPMLRQKLTRLQDSLPEYDRLSELEKELADLQKEKIRREVEYSVTYGKLAEAEEKKEKILREQEALSGCEADKARQEKKAEESAQYVTALSALGRRILKINNLYKEYYSRRQDLEQKSERYRQETERYEQAYNAFLNEQAGILAQELQEGKPCPVCGSCDHPDVRKLSKEAPSQREVEELKKQRDLAEGKRDQSAASLQEITGAFRAEREVFTAEYERILKEELKEEDFKNLKGLDERIGIRLAEGKEAWNNEAAILHKLQKETEKYQQNQAILEQCHLQDRELTEKAKMTERLLQEVRLKEQQMKETVSQKQKELPLVSKQAVRQEIEKINTCLNQLSEENQKAQETYLEFERQYQKKAGEQDNIRNMQIQQREESGKAGSAYKEAVLAAGFEDEGAYEAARVYEEEVPKIQEQLKEYGRRQDEISGKIKSLQDQIAGKVPADTESLKEEIKEAFLQKKSAEEAQMNLYGRLKKNKDAFDHLQKYFEKSKTLRSHYAVISNLSKTANGNLSGSAKMDFETYIQRQYFKQILHAANQRLSQMTSDEFILQCRETDKLGSQGQVGLDLDVYHLVNRSVRDVKTLSGGESFMASLSMALGLADIVQNTAGAIRLETMFIDEGFGSLDDSAREQAMRVLNDLAGGRRLVGIISHVNELKDQIDKKLIVTKTEKGSQVHWELD